MSLFKYIILAVLQGLTEPLPISSSGHMKLFEIIFNGNVFGDLNYEIICNFGSFLAIFLIFRKEIFILIKQFFLYLFGINKDNDYKNGFKYSLNIIIGSIPVIISGVLYKVFDLEEKLTSPYILGFTFLLTAIALYLVRNISGKKDDYDITVKDAITIGLFQAITILPGISRSGTVLVACLLCKLNRSSSLKYTFMLYFPVSLGAMVFEVGDLLNANLNSCLLPYTLGIIIAFIITFVSYKWLSRLVKNGKLWYFSIYCFILSLFVFIFFR